MACDMSDLPITSRPVVTRFAPSPNGSLHLGHAYSAIVSHDLAKEAGGRFLLRIEDIDGPRSRPELADEFRRDLEWLGLEWEEVPAQSTRIAIYEEIAASLLEDDLVYPCSCSRKQIESLPPRIGADGIKYPGSSRGLYTGRRAADDVALRLDIDRAMEKFGPLEWVDTLAGPQVVDPRPFGDVVLVRKDLPASYHLAATVDDAQDEVTLVTRGMDLFDATHIHRLLMAILGSPVPGWHHHRLVLDENGEKLAKRRGSPSLAARREAGEDGRILAEQLRLHNFELGT